MSSSEQRAKAEAQKLLSTARQRIRQKNDTADKAEEVRKLMDEVGRLHAQAEHQEKALPAAESFLDGQHTRQLAERIMRLEMEQKIAREQINHLTHAKIEFALARQRHRERENELQRTSNAELEKQLAELIKQKEQEYLDLVHEVEAVKLQAEQETAMLEAQRDAARSMLEQRQQARQGRFTIDSTQSPSPRWFHHLIVFTMVFTLGIFLGLLGVFLNLIEIPRPAIISWDMQSTGEGGEPQAAPSGAERAGETSPAPDRPQSRAKKSFPKPGGTYRDSLESGGQGPLMVELPGGEYLMGSAGYLPFPDEHPQHQVLLRDFSISRYEITFEEYQHFAAATGQSLPEDSGWGGGRQPVINVTWEQAMAYAQWLSMETGHQYRLPSEREWEYAASAGRKTAYWWGDEIGKGNAVCALCGSRWDGRQPAPVGSLPANPFGLHDMPGNVMEWTVECRHLNYQGAPTQAQVWEGGDCTRRMVRDGSYQTYPRELRITRRSAYNPKARSNELGFRVVRVN